MSDGPVTGVDGAGCIRRLDAVPMDDGHSVLLRLSGARPLAIELDLSQVMDLRMELAIAHTWALGRQRELAERAEQRRAAA
jgi:hypothetical protein